MLLSTQFGKLVYLTYLGDEIHLVMAMAIIYIIHLLPTVYSGTYKLYLLGLYVIHLLPIVTRYEQDIPVVPLSFLKKGMGKMLLYGGIQT